MAGVAQLVRAPDCGSGGRGFKTRHSPHRIPWFQEIHQTLTKLSSTTFLPFSNFDTKQPLLIEWHFCSVKFPIRKNYRCT